MSDEFDEGVTIEEILIEIVDAQIEFVEAVTTGKPLGDPEGLKLRLNDLRDLLENALDDSDET